MRNLFSQVLNMSMTGSIVILLVMLARLMLKRSPKIFSYALWLVVLFRLLCPVAFTAPVSVLNALEPEIRETSGAASVVYFLPAEANRNPDFTFVPAENQSGSELAQAGESEHAGLDIMAIVPYVWIAGTGSMILYSIVQYIRLRRKLVGAVAYTGNVYRADYIDTPFVMGIFAPKIYLPSNIPTQEQKYIIAHERHHIRRCDHIIKLLAYCALCIHWFNPLAWAAFILAGKDMEMSCDEAVIREMGPQIRADYSASLLRLATHKKMIAGMPLAFGEGDTKGRIMNMAKWKKPKLWVSLICVLLCAAVLVACAVNPQTSDAIDDTPTDGSTTPTEERTAATDGSAVVTDTRLVQYGALKMLLPSGMEAADEAGSITLTVDAKTVGGIALRHQKQANSPDTFSADWMAEIGVPEASDAAMSYMSGSSKYADYEIMYFPDIPVNRDANGNIIADEQGTYVLENEVTHYFFVNGTDVCDIWFYNNQIPDIMRENVLKTCVLEGITDIAVTQTALNEEKEALQQCRSVLEQIQSSDACKIETKQENGPGALNDTTLCTDWIHGKDRLRISIIPESGGASMFGGLLVDGKQYDCDSAQQWRESSWWEWTDPWLVSFQWDDSVVAYMDTLEDESGITVMLRIDQPFAEGENEQPHYFVNFNFDTDGAFRNVYVQTNLFMNYSTSRTESVVSLDSELIEAEIQKEYQKAIG